MGGQSNARKIVGIVQENWGWCEGEVCRVLQDAKGEQYNAFEVMWVGMVREFSE